MLFAGAALWLLTAVPVQSPELEACSAKRGLANGCPPSAGEEKGGKKNSARTQWMGDDCLA